jgi:hypothetical protein
MALIEFREKLGRLAFVAAWPANNSTRAGRKATFAP